MSNYKQNARNFGQQVLNQLEVRAKANRLDGNLGLLTLRVTWADFVKAVDTSELNMHYRSGSEEVAAFVRELGRAGSRLQVSFNQHEWYFSITYRVMDTPSSFVSFADLLNQNNDINSRINHDTSN